MLQYRAGFFMSRGMRKELRGDQTKKPRPKGIAAMACRMLLRLSSMSKCSWKSPDS